MTSTVTVTGALKSHRTVTRTRGGGEVCRRVYDVETHHIHVCVRLDECVRTFWYSCWHPTVARMVVARHNCQRGQFPGLAVMEAGCFAPHIYLQYIIRKPPSFRHNRYGDVIHPSASHLSCHAFDQVLRRGTPANSGQQDYIRHLL